jgi:hypothetical protein
LESLIFLKEKRDRTIKGRACADRRKQCETSTPGAVASPTVSLEAVLITATIDAYEERDVVIVDVPGAFLSADMDEEVVMTIRGRLVEEGSNVEHCPATEMLGDQFTKPLQGTLFRKFRAEIQGIPVNMCDADLGWDRPSTKNEQEQDGASPSPQECVGTHRGCGYTKAGTCAATPTAKRKVEMVPTVVGKDTKTGFCALL